jgi:hypothetical protein
VTGFASPAADGVDLHEREAPRLIRERQAGDIPTTVLIPAVVFW